jgi:dodecin
MAKNRQSDSVYRVVDVVGVSEKSWEDAGRRAVETAAGSLRDLRVAEVTQMDMRVKGREGLGFSDARCTLVQVRGLIRPRHRPSSPSLDRGASAGAVRSRNLIQLRTWPLGAIPVSLQFIAGWACRWICALQALVRHRAELLLELIRPASSARCAATNPHVSSLLPPCAWEGCSLQAPDRAVRGHHRATDPRRAARTRPVKAALRR